MKSSLISLSLIVVAALMVGCSPADSSVGTRIVKPVAPPVKSFQGSIQANPNIPPNVKSALLNQGGKK